MQDDKYYLIFNLDVVIDTSIFDGCKTVEVSSKSLLYGSGRIYVPSRNSGMFLIKNISEELRCLCILKNNNIRILEKDIIEIRYVKDLLDN